ncbi:MAG TPA: flagellar basal body rod protein FlgC [Pirellulales bacterium]|jgi:flagellar basal-body rod protein FlgC|nr:flagellar basal body rod protein FlgC [Pirellulales bacterium]
MFTSLDISTSALIAQRTRMDAISGNIANLSTTRNEAGEAVPYQPRFVVFKTDEQTKTPEGAVGVRVDSVETSQKEPLWRYQPGHPDAQHEGPHKGYVAYPNIDMTTEFVDSLNATRAYEANIGVIEASKSMFGQALKIIG